MFNFTPEQKTAALTLGQPLVVTAAAGSGKTTVLVARYLELLRAGLLPHQILTVTFTTDAAEQLRERILKALELTPELSHLSVEVLRTRFIGTIHSFCFTLLSDYGSVVELPQIEEIISDYQFQVRLEKAFLRWMSTLPNSQLKQILKHVPRHEMRPLFKTFYENRHIFSKQSYSNEDPSPLGLCFSSAQPFIFELEKELWGKGLFRFDDLEHLSLRLLTQHSGLRQKLQSQFQSILIDEFQDTSQNQWMLFQALIDQNPSKLFVVGDPKQSIYSFRQADVSIFFEVSRLTQSWGGLVTELNTNFRTQSCLISDINRLSESFFRDSSLRFQPMESGNPESGDPIQIIHYECDPKIDKKESELNAVISQVERLLQSGVSPAHVALLFRMGDRIETYTTALKGKNIPVECTQTLSLFDHYDILGLHHFLNALAHPKDEFALFSFFNTPWIGLTVQQLSSFKEDLSNEPFENKLKKILPQNLDWFFELSQKSYITVREALHALFSHTTYFPVQAEAFLEWLKPLTERPYSVSEALTDLELWKKEGILFKSKSKDSEQGAVKLMTVHASKGLEFEHVFLVDNLRKPPTHPPSLLIHPKEKPGMKYRLENETVMCPQYQKLKELKERLDSEESRRILYVALTRAKTSLTVFIPQDKKGIPQGSWAQLLESAETTELK